LPSRHQITRIRRQILSSGADEELINYATQQEASNRKFNHFSPRGQRVILAADLARIYGVETRVLNQSVKRNIQRFPGDFVFQVSPKEANEIFRSRSQSVILKRGQNIKYLPYAFTEHGAIMAANVIK
jgi:ORF6N domain